MMILNLRNSFFLARYDPWIRRMANDDEDLGELSGFGHDGGIMVWCQEIGQRGDRSESGSAARD